MTQSNKSKQNKHKLYIIIDVVTLVLAFLFLFGYAYYITIHLDSQQNESKSDDSIKERLYVENHVKKELNLGYLEKPVTPIQSESEVIPHEEKKAEPSRNDEEVHKTIQFEATAYTSKCEGCIGITKNGTNVKNTIYDGDFRIIATDPKVIPTNSLVEVQYEDVSFFAIAADTGGDIKNYRIDVLVKTKQQAFEFGRRIVNVTILREGNG